MNIEVELRSFITKTRYEELLKFFRKEGQLVSETDEVTYYLSGAADLRIQKNNVFAKIWLKKGEIHDEQREEIEIKFDKDDFDKAEQLFLALGYTVDIKWFRHRNLFHWEGIDVSVDDTKGYGYIIEFEKIAGSQEESEKTLAQLKKRMNDLKVRITPREKFEEKYEHYRNNWQKLTKNVR